MLRERTGIGAGLLFTVIISSFLGISNQQTAYLAAKYGGHNGYLGLIGAYFLSIPLIFAAIDLQRMYPGKSLIEYAPLVLGKALGKVVSSIFLLLIFLLLVWSVRSTAEVINLYLLQRTPLHITALLFIVSVLYLTCHGIEGITKTCSFILPLALFVTILTLLESYQYFSFERISPIFDINIETFSASFHLFYAFFPLANIFIFLPYLTDKKKGLSIILTATTIGVVILLFFIIANIGTFGAKGVLRYSWPITELTKAIKMPYLLQSFYLFYIITWLSQIYIGAGSCYYAAAQGCTQLFSCLNYKWFILILLPIVVFAVLILPGVIEVRQFFDYFRIIGFAILLVIPFMLWSVAKLKKGGKRKNA